MIFEVKTFKKEDFIAEFFMWSRRHQFAQIDARLLPENVLVCFDNEGTPLYCVWFWKTDSATGIATYVMANPEAKNRRGGLEFLLHEMIVFAKNDGIRMIFFPTSSDIVAKQLLKLGFQEGDIGFGQYFGII